MNCEVDRIDILDDGRPRHQQAEGLHSILA